MAGSKGYILTDVNSLPVITSGWRDSIGQPTVKSPGANDPTFAALIGGIKAYSFAPATMNEIWFVYHIDHDYELGTTLYMHAHWSMGGVDTGVVRWGFEYTYAAGHNQANFPATTTAYKEQAYQGTAYRHMLAEVADADVVPSAGVEPDGLLLVRLFRDAAHANDTNGDPAFLLTADLHYRSNRVNTLNKAPDFDA